MKEKYICVVQNKPRFLFKLVSLEVITRIEMNMSSTNPEEQEKNLWIFTKDRLPWRVELDLFDFDRFLLFMQGTAEENVFIIHAKILEV